MTRLWSALLFVMVSATALAQQFNAPLTPSTAVTPIGPLAFTPAKIVNPVDFGARCDGVTDDTKALQNALNALQNHSTFRASGVCAFTSQLVFPSGLVNITIRGGTLLYTGASTTLSPVVKIASGNNGACEGQGWIVSGLRINSATVMTSGVALQIGDLCRSQFNGLIVGDQNTSGFMAAAGNGNWWDAVEVAGGNTIRFDAMVARGQHDGVRAHGDVTSGPTYTNLTDVTFNSLTALGSSYGVNISGAVGGILLDNGGDFVNNSVSNVRISQDDVASPNAQVFLSDIPIDGTAANSGVGLDLADPGSSSYLILNGTWLSYARNQCFLVESTVSSWVIQMNGGQIITCGSSGALTNAAFDNESTSANVHIHFTGTLFNKNLNTANVYNNPGAGNPIDLQGVHLVDASAGSIAGSWSGSLFASDGSVRMISSSGAVQVKAGANSVLLTAGSGKNICAAALGGVGVWIQAGQVIPGDPTCSTGGGAMNLGSSTYPWTNLYASGLIATGTKPTNTGTCAITTQVGGTTAGAFAFNGACASGTLLLTFASGAPNGWICDVQDMTTAAATIRRTAYTATTATFAVSGALASDQASFKCTGM